MKKNLIGIIATGIIGVLIIFVVVMTILNNNMLSVVKRNINYQTMGLGKDKSSIILSAKELYEKKIINKKMYEKNKNSYVLLEINNKNKLMVKYFYDLIKPVIVLNGEAEINLEYQKEYQELGVMSALDDLCGDLTQDVKITGEVDSNTLGEYIVTYSVSDLSGNKAESKRTVKVIDSQKPTISLKGNKEITLELNTKYKEPGYNAKDNHDGNLTKQVRTKGKVNVTEIGKYFLTYTVKDSSGNKTSITRTVNIIDYSKPTITLKGNSKIVLEKDMKYIEPGFDVSDKYDNNIADKVNIKSNINLNEIGNYEIIYHVINSKGKENVINRTVEVIESTPAQIILNGDATMNLLLNEIYAEPGFSVKDKYDINLPVDIKVYDLKDNKLVDSIDSTNLGNYKIVYEITNSRGLTTKVERLVNIVTLIDFSISGPTEIVIPGTIESDVTNTYNIMDNLAIIDPITLGTTINWRITDLDNNVIPNTEISIASNGELTVTNLANEKIIRIYAEIDGIERYIDVIIKKDGKLTSFAINGLNEFNLTDSLEYQYDIINPKNQYGDNFDIKGKEIIWEIIVPNPAIGATIDSEGVLTLDLIYGENIIIIQATILGISEDFIINKAIEDSK